MDTLKCTCCHIEKPWTKEYYPTREGKVRGGMCRECRNKKYVRKVPNSGICRHCGKPIIDRPKFARYHIDADHPDCYQAHCDHLRAVQKSHAMKTSEWKKAWRAKRKTMKKCKCGNPLPEGYRFKCPICWSKVQGHMNTDWAFGAAAPKRNGRSMVG